MLDLVSAGEGYDDFIFHSLDGLPRSGRELKTEAFQRSPGGSAVITAIAAARLGLDAAVISGLSDESARAVRDEGVAVTNLRRPGEPAALTVALSTPRDRRFVTYVGMNGRLPARLHLAVRTLRARHVHFAFPPPQCARWISTIRALRARRTTTSWDFGWNPALRRDPEFLRLAGVLDYLFLNRAEALLYADRSSLNAAIRFWRRADCHVVIRLGEGGSLVVGGAVGAAEIRASARRVRAVETTGAGDAFNAGFLTARLEGCGLPAALRRGNDVGALSVRRAGGIAGLPRRRRSP